jgi:hypothetical protein
MTNMLIEKSDDAYISWVLNWNIHSFATNIFNILNGNIYYPYLNTLAYSDIYLTFSTLVAIPVMLVGQPAFAYNLCLLIAFATLGFSVYLLSLYLTKNHLVSIVGGTIAAFSPYATSKVMHLQLIGIAPVPLAILFFLKFLDKKEFKYLLITAIFFVLQMCNSFLPGYFIVVSCLIIFIGYLITKRITLKQFPWRKIILLGILSILIVLPVIIPYYQVSKEFNYVRDIRDTIRFANRPDYTLFPGFTTRLQDFLQNTFYKNSASQLVYDGFMGLVFFIISGIAIAYRLVNRKRNWFLFDLFFVIGIFSYILSLGPALQWAGHVIKHPFLIPLPYAVFYYLAPGFNGFRDSSRWEMLFLMSFSVSIAIFLSICLKQKSSIIKLLLVGIICFGVLWEFKFPYPSHQVPTKENFPKVYNFIKSLPSNVVISEFPIYNWGSYPLVNSEDIRDYYGILSFKKTINGASGFSPPPWQATISYLINNFPSNSSIKLLKSQKVNYIVLHAREYDQLRADKYKNSEGLVLSGNSIKMLLDKNSMLKLVYVNDSDFVYQIK